MQQVEVGASIHLALDELQLVDLTFRLSAAPDHGQRRLDRGLILSQSGGEGFNDWDAVGLSLSWTLANFPSSDQP